MNKYFSPTIQIEETEGNDIILTSTGYEVKTLEGVDTGNDKSAVINASRWF